MLTWYELQASSNENCFHSPSAENNVEVEDMWCNVQDLWIQSHVDVEIRAYKPL